MIIRTSKDIPDEIKGLVEQFYMQGLNVALASVPGLKQAKPELIPLIECTLQLFENAPDSVFMFYDELIAAYAAQDMSIDLDFSLSDFMDDQNSQAQSVDSISEMPSVPNNFPPSSPTAEQPAVRKGTIEAPDTILHSLHDEAAQISLSPLLEDGQEHSRFPALRPQDSPKKRNKTMFFGGDILSEEEVHQRIQSANVDRNNESIHCIKTPVPGSFSSKTPVPKGIQVSRLQADRLGKQAGNSSASDVFRALDARFEKNNERSLVSENRSGGSIFGKSKANLVEEDLEVDFASSSPRVSSALNNQALNNRRMPEAGGGDHRFDFTPPPMPNRPRRKSFNIDFDENAPDPSERDIDFASLSNSSLNIFEDKPAGSDRSFGRPSKPSPQLSSSTSQHSRNLAAIMSDFSDSAPRTTIPSLSALSSSAHLHSLKRSDMSGLGRDISNLGDPNERSNIGRARSENQRPTKPSLSPAVPPPNPMELDGGPLEKLAPLSRVPALRCKLNEIITRKDISSRAGFIISMIDGITSLQDIIDLSAWSAEETATILLELERMNIVSFY